MRQIDEYFSTNVDRALYHYTSIDSLVGMATSKTLWASNIYYLNDSKEIIHACEVLNDVLDPRIIFGDQQSPEIEFQKQLRQWIKTCAETIHNIFVFSFSEESSLLSQWRSYTPHGKGVSIGFSPEILTTVAHKSNFRIAECLYKRHEHEDVARGLLKKLLITFRQEHATLDLTQAHPSQCYHPFLEKFRENILQVLAIIKHQAFEEEKEWRLISSYHASYMGSEIKFRKGASMLVPYFELPLGDSKPYFGKVILGPSPHQNLSLSALSMFLSNQKLCSETENSVIPYREW